MRRRERGPLRILSNGQTHLAATLALSLSLLHLACADSEPLFPEFGERRSFGDHTEVDVRFENGDVTLAGTIYLPPGPGPVPAVAVNPGSSWTVRSTWLEVGFFVTQLEAAVLSYDKRGQGESTGTCCPNDPNATFDMLAGDVVAGARALKQLPEIDATLIGAFGSSQGGWIVPLAANSAPEDVGFIVVTVGGAVSTGQEGLYDQLTGYDVCQRTATPLPAIIDQLEAAGPSGFDPRSSLEQLTQPAIWIYGGMDFSHPADLSVANLEAILASSSKPWTIVVFPNANHDLIENGGICQEEGPLVDVITPLRAWFDGLTL